MLLNNFFIYNEKLMKFYHDLDIIIVNNIIISIFEILLCIVKNVPARIANNDCNTGQVVLIRAG